MLSTLNDTWQSYEEDPHFSLQDVEGFPYEAYSKQLQKYRIAEEWFTGTALDQVKQKPDLFLPWEIMAQPKYIARWQSGRFQWQPPLPGAIAVP